MDGLAGPPKLYRNIQRHIHNQPDIFLLCNRVEIPRKSLELGWLHIDWLLGIHLGHITHGHTHHWLAHHRHTHHWLLGHRLLGHWLLGHRRRLGRWGWGWLGRCQLLFRNN